MTKEEFVKWLTELDFDPDFMDEIADKVAEILNVPSPKVKLYVAKCTVYSVFVAAPEPDMGEAAFALLEEANALLEEANYSGFNDDAISVTECVSLPPGWTEDAVPWGSADERPLKDYKCLVGKKKTKAKRQR